MILKRKIVNREFWWPPSQASLSGKVRRELRRCLPNPDIVELFYASRLRIANANPKGGWIGKWITRVVNMAAAMGASNADVYSGDEILPANLKAMSA